MKTAKTSPTSYHDDNDWMVEEDLRTMQRAEEISEDPKRLAAVMKMAKVKAEVLLELTKKKGLRS